MTISYASYHMIHIISYDSYVMIHKIYQTSKEHIQDVNLPRIRTLDKLLSGRVETNSDSELQHITYDEVKTY